MFTTAEGGTRAERRRHLPASGRNEPPFKLEARPEEAVVVRAKGCWGRRSAGLRGGWSPEGAAPPEAHAQNQRRALLWGSSFTFGDSFMRYCMMLTDDASSVLWFWVLEHELRVNWGIDCC